MEGKFLVTSFSNPVHRRLRRTLLRPVILFNFLKQFEIDTHSYTVKLNVFKSMN